MKPVRLGSWRTTAGNGVDVFLVASPELVRELALEWDRFPLSKADEAYYLTEILPAIELRAREYFELVGPALVVLG